MICDICRKEVGEQAMLLVYATICYPCESKYIKLRDDEKRG